MEPASTAPERRRFLLVSNPVAGRTGNALIASVVRALIARGATVTQVPDGQDMNGLKDGDADKFRPARASAGGDGTVRAVGTILAGTPMPIGLIPRGTGNVLAEEIRLPREPVKIARILMTGPCLSIPGARINGEPFYLMAGIGFDGEIIQRLDVATKRAAGKLAYVRPTLAALRLEDPALTVEVDGAAHEAGWVLVSNAYRYGGSFRLTGKAGLEMDGLVAILIPRSGRLRRMVQLLALGAGRLEQVPGVKILPARRIKVTAARPVAVEVDGDDFGAAPVEIVWGEPVLPLIVPQSYANRWAAAHASPSPHS